VRELALLPVLVVALGGCLSGNPRPPCSDDGTIHTLCGFENPEDLEYVERAGLVLVSNMRSEGEPHDGGFIAAFVPGTRDVFRLWPGRNAEADAEPEPALADASCTTPPDPAVFRPHGLTSRLRRDHGDETLVFVTAHAGDGRGREAVEIFELTGAGPEAHLAWKACIPMPPSVQGNDLAVSEDGTVVVSNFRPDASLKHIVEASLLGTITGDMIAWTPANGWSHVGDTKAAMANGVALSRDGKMLFYSESMTGSIHRLPMDGSGGAIAIDVAGNPDNLSWTTRGTLLVASHTGGYAFAACLFGHRPCTTSWAVFEIDPNTLSVRKVLSHDGSRLGAVSTALQVGNNLLLGSVFDDRIGIVEVHRREEESRTARIRRTPCVA
jgi:hypothetical protein